MKSLSRCIARCTLLAAPVIAAALALVAPAAQAVSEADLLPVDQAFALSAQADSRDRIQLQWKIAPGYYLYRHRIGVKSGQGFAAGELSLPEGESKHDEFFGQVQTYRTRLQATLAGTAEPRALVELIAGRDRVIGSGYADARGFYVVRVQQTLAPGAYSIAARVRDAAGNWGTRSLPSRLLVM